MTPPEPERVLPFALPDITEAEVEAVVRVLRSKWLTTGAVTREFEKRFAEEVDAEHAVAVNSCTAALHLSLEALGVGAGDAVFVPTFTFAATGEVVRYLGAVPVLVDVDPVTLNIDPASLRAAIDGVLRDGGQPKVIVPVHYAGAAAELGQIWEIARHYGLGVVEDAAHAFPSSFDGHPVGWTPPDVPSTVCFSFYATKTITTGEGGMVTTRDAAIADRIRLMSLHGLSKQAWNRYSGGTWRYDIVEPGYKYNLTDMASALGLVQLDRAHSMRDRRAEIASMYTARFEALDLTLPAAPADRKHAWHLYPVRLPDRVEESTRAKMIDVLRDSHGVGTSVHFIPLHLHSYYQREFGYRSEDFPIALQAFQRCVSLPIYSAMTDAEVERVANAVLAVHDELLGSR